ncbi:hypothetical protein KDW36_17800 [Burkholderia dolosa]|uniref:hypothetical protein n=1 Tax=Burkholderia dolosa TaxID=152500 RepID=UPI001B9F975D|nr:hypothetical protein [Burkholderia dolosa]MBR8315041.1 hypothetical protein [Burkholderia dolosa]
MQIKLSDLAKNTYTINENPTSAQESKIALEYTGKHGELRSIIRCVDNTPLGFSFNKNGTYNNKEQELKRLREKFPDYSKKITSTNFTAEHVICSSALKGGTPKRLHTNHITTNTSSHSQDDIKRISNRLRNSGLAYYETAQRHASHEASGMNSSEGSTSENQRSLLQDGHISAAIQINQHGYLSTPSNSEKKSTEISNDSFFEALRNIEYIHIPTIPILDKGIAQKDIAIDRLKISEEDKLEAIVMRICLEKPYEQIYVSDVKKIYAKYSFPPPSEMTFLTSPINKSDRKTTFTEKLTKINNKLYHRYA